MVYFIVCCVDLIWREKQHILYLSIAYMLYKYGFLLWDLWKHAHKIQY